VVQSKKAGGTRTIWDVVKHSIEILRDPDGSGPSMAYSDLAGLASGETRQVSCWLRGSDPSLPQKFTQGILLIGPDGMVRHHWFRHKTRLVTIPHLDRVEQVISPASRSNGTRLRRGRFSNVVTSGPSGKVEFVVSGVGPALVREAVDGFRSGRNPMS
jgi:hypothetical protein